MSKRPDRTMQALRASATRKRLASDDVANKVAAARERGHSWEEIGEALGITRQGAAAAYAKSKRTIALEPEADDCEGVA